MPILRPLSKTVTRPISFFILVTWLVVMAVLVSRSYAGSASPSLAADLGRYGTAAVWRGVYYRGEKIGFTVSQTIPNEDGFELEEDGRLQMSLFGATTAATIRTTRASIRASSFNRLSSRSILGPARSRCEGTSPAHGSRLP